MKQRGRWIALGIAAIVAVAAIGNPAYAQMAGDDTQWEPELMAPGSSQPPESNPFANDPTISHEPAPETPPAPEVASQPSPAPTAAPQVAAEPTPVPPAAPEVAAEPTPEPEQQQQVTAEPTPEPEAPQQASAGPTSQSLTDEERDAILAEPTKSIELYEQIRKDRIQIKGVPHWSGNFTFVPYAFSKTEMNVPPVSPTFIGVLFSGEWLAFRSAGTLSVGAEFGMYPSLRKDVFPHFPPGFVTAGPYAQYQLLVFRNQPLVPTARAELEFVRYAFARDGVTASGVKQLPRFDLGILVFLNVLESSAAADMFANWGVRRTYLSLTYSMAVDADKQDMDLTDNSVRGGFRFEF